MKKKVFLAHDPGGYDVVSPVYNRFKQAGEAVELYCVGPAAQLCPLHVSSEEQVFALLETSLLNEMSTLITGTSWGSDFELRAIQRCKAHHVTTVTLLDYWSNYVLRLMDKDKTAIFPDYYIVMDEMAKKEAILEGVPQHILYDLGHPGLDRFINQKTPFCKESPGGRKVLFLCQPLFQLYGDSLGYTERTALHDCLEAFATEGWDFFVKFHPKDNAAIIQEYKNYMVEGQLIDLIPEFGLIVSMNSMGLLHAILIGVPGLSYQPNLSKPDVCITNKLGLSPLITSYDALLIKIRENQFQHQLMRSLADAEARLPWLDGHSTERIYRFIERL